MSYSFHVRGATKADATEALVIKLDQTVQEQPVHAKDRDAIEANARAVIGLMPEPGEGVDLVVSCNGYITWTANSRRIRRRSLRRAPTSRATRISSPAT